MVGEKEFITNRVFSFYKVINFSDYIQPKQMGFDSILLDGKDRPTTIKKTKKHGDYEQYLIEFDYKQKIHSNSYFIGEYFDEVSSTIKKYKYVDFDHYYQRYSFNGYIKKDRVLFAKSYKVVEVLIHSLGAFKVGPNKPQKSKCDDKLLLEKYDINMTNIIKKSEIIGAWFSYDNIMNLKSGAAFGKEVDQSMIYKQLEKNGGKLSSIVVGITFKQNTYTVIISKNSSISIRQATDIDLGLELVDYIINEIIL
jgi:hypothetical protein